MATPLDKFLDLVIRSELVSPTELIESCAGFPVAHKDGAALEELCQHLIGKGLLTAWQCDKLRQGKWKGFFLDGYCFLRQIGKDETSSTYLCKEATTGNSVTMRVTPPMLAPQDGRIHYELREPPDDTSLN